MSAPDERLVSELGHRFSDPELLERALTHRSRGAQNNERLEFLGDAILNFLVAESLYHGNPRAHEGRLTRLRATLVRRETLASVARDLGLGAALKLGPGELKSGGRDRDSILADALEAVVGAVYLDGGLDACRDVFVSLFNHRMADASRNTGLKDPKTRLQELLQSRGLALPVYRVVQVEGAAHDQSFTVECAVPDLAHTATGNGASRRKAEQDAAKKAIEQLDRDEQ